ncbi:MAG: hypothetical protein ACTHLT_11180 [Devosia sp.]
MRYWTAGPVELFLIDRRLSFDEYSRREFWADVDSDHEGISEACGCYVFAMRRGNSYVPWYVGKAERQTFKRECLTEDKVRKYEEVLLTQKGTPTLSFYGRVTRERLAYSRPSTSQHRDIRYLERLLISHGVKRNKHLINIQDTRLQRTLEVPGLLNTRQGRLRTSDLLLKEMFRY